MFEARFFMKPHFQLRDFGVSAPLVSFSQNVSSSVSRHPVIVTGDELSTVAAAADSTGSGFAFNSGAAAAAGVFLASTGGAGFVVASGDCVSAAAGAAGPFATTAFGASRRAVA